MALSISKVRFLVIAEEEASTLGEKLIAPKPLFELIHECPAILSKKKAKELSLISNDENALRRFLKKLLQSYFNKRKARIALRESQTVPDPAVDTALEAFGNIPRKDLKVFSKHHRWSMAAENKVGDLLETYLAEVLEPKGWIWCCGNFITGIDFFKPSLDPNKHILLQVKNRSNSENSSSKSIRELVEIRGCPVPVLIWFRCRATDGRTCWNQLIGNADESIADEQRFQDFVRKYPLRR